MEIYLLLLLYVLVCGILIPQIGKKGYLILVFTPIVLIAGLRAPNVGSDTLNYLYYYDVCVANPMSFFLKSGLEPGYKLIMILSSFIFKNGQTWILICAALIGVLVAKFVYDNSDDVVLSTYLFIGLYYYLISFNAVRQFVSIAVALQAYKYIKEEKRIKSLLILLVASSIHYSSIIFVILWVLGIVKMRKKTVGILTVVGIILSLSLYPLIVWFINKIDRFTYYLNDEYFLGERGLDINVLLYIVQFLTIIILLWCMKKENDRMNSENHLEYTESEQLAINYEFRNQYLITMAMTLVLILNLMSVSVRLMARLVYGYSMFMILAIPRVCMAFSKRNQIVVKVIAYVLVFIYFYLMLTHNNHYVVPYSFCF